MTKICSNQYAMHSPFGRKLSDDQCQKLYWACLEILEHTGVRMYEQEAVDLLKKAGAHVTDGNRVHITPGLVEKAFSTVPKSVTLCDRNGNPVIRAEGHRSYFGTGSDCLHILDHRTGEYRNSTLQDIVDGMIVCDALEHIAIRCSAGYCGPLPDGSHAQQYHKTYNFRHHRISGRCGCC